MSQGLPESLIATINSAIERTEIGGGLFKQLSVKDRSCLVSENKILINKDQSTIVFLLVKSLRVLYTKL